MKQYGFINVLRPIAAFWVLIAHCLIWGGFTGFILDPKLAVDLFMMISGFLMMAISTERHLLDRNLAKDGFLFFSKRFFRIAPAYYVSLALAIILGRFFLDGYSILRMLSPQKWMWQGNEIYDPARFHYAWTNILSHVTFAFGFSPQGSCSTFLPDWSLGLEMQFYAVFPILFVLRKKLGINATGLLCACAVLLTTKLFHRFGVNFFEPSLLTLKLQFFMIGMLIYDFQESLPRHEKLSKFGIILLLAWCERKGLGSFLITTAMAIAMITMRLFGERAPQTSFSCATNRAEKFSVYLSEASYSVYLFHGFFISLAGQVIRHRDTTSNIRIAFMIPFVAVGTLALAHFVHKFIEAPGIRLGKAINDRIHGTFYSKG